MKEKIKEEALKELKRIEFALSELKLLKEQGSDLLNMIQSYFEDAKHFYNKGEYLESFELSVYLFGILDALANLEVIDPGKAKKHYKIEQ